MNLANGYPTGVDYELFLTDPITEGVTPDFRQEEPLDVAQVSFIQDGNVTPLYDIAERNPHHMVYSRKLVNGTLSFNYSQKFARRFRSRLQSIWGKVLWVRLSYTNFNPTRRIRDTYRVSPVYEHAFQHQPQPHAVEQVPFTARELVLVERERAELSRDIHADLRREADSGTIQASDLYRNRQSRYLAYVERVIDGDTFEVVLDATGENITIRPPGFDTPETPGQDYGNQDGDENYGWPTNLRPDANQNLGVAGGSPTAAQLDAWAELATERATEWLEGEKVWLITDQGAPATGGFGRSIFRVDALNEIVPDHSGIEPHHNVGRMMIRHGYAVQFESRSIETDASGTYRNLHEQLQDELDTVRSNAGTAEAAGVWYSFDVAQWRQFADRL